MERQQGDGVLYACLGLDLEGRGRAARRRKACSRTGVFAGILLLLQMVKIDDKLFGELDALSECCGCGAGIWNLWSTVFGPRSVQHHIRSLQNLQN